LVVEDEEPSAAALQEVLLNASCDVEVVESGEAALLALGARAFSLAIVDFALPGMNGRALLERMAADPNWARIPAIVVSGHQAALPGRAVAFLRKPVRAAELLALVQRYSHS
jgi:CheY-like chemotaxis protein